MKRNDVIFRLCGYCHGSRNQTILAVFSPPRDPDLAVENFYITMQCNGCSNISFLHHEADYDVMLQVGDNEFEPDTVEEIFPKAIDSYIEKSQTFLLPPIVKSIYVETLKSIKDDSKILAGIGLRAVIEAICSDQKIVGKDLKVRINKLIGLGVVSKEDVKRLHGIRFLGNDAAHDIKEAEKESVLMALKIIDHIIDTLYLFRDAESLLDLPIESYDEFESTLIKSIKKKMLGSKVTIRGLLGKNIRRIEALNDFELKFATKVKNGELEHFSSVIGKDNQNNVYEIVNLTTSSSL